MTPNPFRLGLLAAALLCAPLRSEESGLRELLRDALYTEEVTRDPDSAAKQYEELIARHDAQRPFAANALFRLAEIRKRQDRKEDAIALYRRLLFVFPDAEPQAKLSRERLADFGEAPPAGGGPALDEESQELQRLQQLAESSPDMLRKPEIILNAVAKGWVRPVAFVLDRLSSSAADSLALERASSDGHLAIVKMVLARGPDPKGEVVAAALLSAAKSGNLEIAKALISAGASADGIPLGFRPTPLLIATREGNAELARLLIDQGADVNRMPPKCFPILNGSPDSCIGGPLHEAICFEKPQIIELLLDRKADINLTEPASKITPLWLAAWKGQPNLIKRLLDLGADPDLESAGEMNPLRYPGKSSPLERAIIAGSVEGVKLLLESKKARNTPVKSANLYDVVYSAKSLDAPTLEIIRLLLDHGADPNSTLPPFKSLLEEIAKRGDSEKIWQVVELLLERGSKVDPTWEKSGFATADAELRVRLIRRISYAKWVAEKAIRIVDLTEILQPWKPAVADAPHAAPPMLEQWLLSEEQGGLRRLRKNFLEVALYRKTEAGIVEVANFRLDATEAFPKLEWGDILEKRNQVNGDISKWPTVATRTMTERVAATPSPPQPGPPMPAGSDAPAPQVIPPPSR